METEIGRILNESDNQLPDDLLDIDFSKYSDIDLDLDDIEEPKEKEQYDPKANWVTADESKLNDNFWKWFDYSYAVKNGKPLVLYHGTPSDKITEFDNSRNASTSGRSVWGRGGFYFTAQESTAKEYGKNIIPVFLSIQRPFKSGWSKLKLDIMFKLMYGREPNQEDDDLQLDYLESKLEYPADLLQTLTDKNGKWGYSLEEIMEANGYDSIIDGHVFIALYPNQIKSVDNNGEWSTNSNNIYEKLKKQENKNMHERLEEIENGIFITNSDYDVRNLIQNKPKDYRIVYDTNIGYYMIGDANKYIHNQLMKSAMRSGLYASEELYSENDVIDYIDHELGGGTGNVNWLYFSPKDDPELDDDRKDDYYYIKYCYDFGCIYLEYNSIPSNIPILQILGNPLKIEDLGDDNFLEEQENKNMTEIGKILGYLEEKKKSVGTKLDKYTAVITDFSKIASDELSKDNLDTNDNGIKTKEKEDGTVELTPGQKSLAWESYQDKMKKYRKMNEISDELKNKVADKRKENMDKAIAKYAKNQTLNKTHSKADIKKAEPKQSWSYYAGGLCPSIYLKDMGITLYMPCPEEGYPNWNLYLDEDDSTPTKQFKSMPTIQDIEKAIKEDTGEDVKLPDYGEAGKEILTAYEKEYGNAESKVAWDTEVAEDHIVVYAPMKFIGDVDDLIRELNNFHEIDIDDFDYDLTASDRDGDSYEGETANVDLWVRRAENKKGTECSIRIAFPETDDYIWAICPTYDKFTKFLKEVAYVYLGDNLLEGMKILDNLVKETSTEGESKGFNVDEASSIVKAIINNMKRMGGGTTYKDHFEIEDTYVSWDIRDWGNWGTDQEWEEDDDFMRLHSNWEEELDDLINTFRKNNPNYDISYSLGEKRYIGIYVEAKAKNEGFNDLKLKKPRLRSLADDMGDLAKDTVVNTAHALTGDVFRKRRKRIGESKINEISYEELNKQKTQVLARYLNVEPTQIEYDYGFYMGDREWEVLNESEAITACEDHVAENMDTYIWSLVDKIDLQDFIEMFCKVGRNYNYEVDFDDIAEYLVERDDFDKSEIIGEEFEGFYIKEL